MKWARGYTIIEVMLFLAVSGALLSIAFIGFGTRQATIQFSQSMQDVESLIKQTLSDTQNGSYPDPINTNCRIDIATSKPVVEAQAGSRLGGNNACVFLGKVLSIGFPDNQSITVDTIVGNRVLANASTSAAFPVSGGNLVREQRALQWGARVIALTTATGGRTYTNVVGSVNGLKETRQQPIVFSGASYYTDFTGQVVPYIDNQASYQPANSAHFAIGNNFSPVLICFERRDGQQRAQIEIGSTGQSLTTRLTFDTCEAS